VAWPRGEPPGRWTLVNRALQALREGRPFECDELAYRDHVRFALWKVAADCDARGRRELAERCWRAIAQLDARFGLASVRDGAADAADPESSR